MHLKQSHFILVADSWRAVTPLLSLLSFGFSFLTLYFGIQFEPGRFDFQVQLPAPAASERCALLNHEIQKRLLQCSDDILLEVASKCDGYDAYDLVFGSFQNFLNI